MQQRFLQNYHDMTYFIIYRSLVILIGFIDMTTMQLPYHINFEIFIVFCLHTSGFMTLMFVVSVLASNLFTTK